MNASTAAAIGLDWVKLQNTIGTINTASSSLNNVATGTSLKPTVVVRKDFPKDAQMLQALYDDEINIIYGTPDSKLIGENRYDTMGKYEDYLKSLGVLPKHPDVDLSTFHEGGIVGNAPTKLTDIVNKLFNVKPGEQIVKSLIGELQIPQQNIMNNFVPNMQNLVNSIVPRSAMVGANVNVTNNVSFSGSGSISRSDLDKIANYLDSRTMNDVKKWGRK